MDTRKRMPPALAHPDRHDDPARPSDAAIARTGLRAFFKIAEAWSLTPPEQMSLLGLTARSTLYKWRTEPPKRLGPDNLQRIRYLIRIYTDLHLIFGDHPERANRWPRRPNSTPLFGGKSALELMLEEGLAEIAAISQYLSGQLA